MRPPVIALTGAAGSGKTTVAMQLMLKYSYARVRFADGLKRMLLELGLSPEEVDGALKEEPSSLLLGATPRHAMQTLGTEWGRNLIHQDLWAHTWKVRAENCLRLGQMVVCDDCRYENEVAFVRSFVGAELWRLQRSAATGVKSHSSEEDFHSFKYDRLIRNHSTVHALELRVDTLMGLRQ